MKAEIIIPDVGATGGDVRIVIWLVRPGDFVAAGTPLVTIETDKATEDIEAFSNGYVDEILAEAGSDVPVGSVIATLRETQKETPLDVAADQTSFAESDLPYGQSLPSSVPELIKSMAAVEAKRVFASPAARRLAREKNIDLSSLNSGGEYRTIHLAHVKQAISSRTGRPVGAQTSTHNARRYQQNELGETPSVESGLETFTGGNDVISNGNSPATNRNRRAIAERVTQSKAEIPHFYMSTTVDMTEANHARVWLVKAAETSAVVGPTINDLIVRAAALALRDTPQLNTLFRKNSTQHLSSINVGVVIGTDIGVVIPIVANVDQLDIYALAEASRALKVRAQERRLMSRELKRSCSISVSNLGMYGVDQFTAIIDPAQSSILACGAVKQSPTVHNGEVGIRELMAVTLSVDHRIVDGAIAAKFLKQFRRFLEIPQLLITGKASHE